MMQVDVKAQPVITAEIKTQIDDSPIVNPTKTEGIDNLQLLNDAELKNADALKTNTALAKEFGNIMPDIIKNFRQLSDNLSRTNQNLPAVRTSNLPAVQNKNLPTVVEKGLLAPINTGTSVIQSLGSGDPAGAAIKGVQGAAGTLKNVGEVVSTAGLEGIGSTVASIAAPLLIVGGLAAATNALANQYQKEMPNIFGTGRMFDNVNDEKSMHLYQRLNTYNKGTGLDISEFNSVSKILRESGVANSVGSNKDKQLDVVGNIAQTTSRWAYATGGSAERYAELAGLMSRYGGSKDVSGDFNYLVSSGKAMGLNDSQIPEFLSGIQKVMEEGIAKGFTRSSTDVANTLVMFSKMSGNNPFWSGEQGARKLNQINSGISGATSLSKMEDVLVYSAFNEAYGKEGGSYLDIMEKMEGGLDAKTYGILMGNLDARFGNDEEAKVEAIRKMTGLNYKASREMLHLRDKGNITDTTVKDVFEAPENYNKETRWQESLNKLAATMAKIGENPMELKVKAMDEISSDVEIIKNFLIGTDVPAEVEETISETKVDEGLKNSSIDTRDSDVVAAQQERYKGASKIKNAENTDVWTWLETDYAAEWGKETFGDKWDLAKDLLGKEVESTGGPSPRAKKGESLNKFIHDAGASLEVGIGVGNGQHMFNNQENESIKKGFELVLQKMDKVFSGEGIKINLTESK